MKYINLVVLMVCGYLFTEVVKADVSIYSKVDDKTVCKYKEIKGTDEGPESCEFLCNTPIVGVSTKLLSCYDYQHLFFEIDGRWYSTWNAMTQVGGFSGLGNKQGIVEWVMNSKENKKRESLKGLIVRFNGTDQNSKYKEALAVFGLQKDEVCWKGNFSSNQSARQGLKGKCKEILKPESTAKK